MESAEARARLAVIRSELKVPKIVYGKEIGPQGDLYRALAGVVSFLEDALV
ncbi:hypothetical protein [Mycobacterium phage WXIN]|nr:hypothetical protein [Mycobacterium phage WXIN]